MIELNDPRVIAIAKKHGYNLIDARKVLIRTMRSFTWKEYVFNVTHVKW